MGDVDAINPQAFSFWGAVRSTAGLLVKLLCPGFIFSGEEWENMHAAGIADVSKMVESQ